MLRYLATCVDCCALFFVDVFCARCFVGRLAFPSTSLRLASTSSAFGFRFRSTAAYNDASTKLNSWTNNAKLRSWVLDHVKLMTPANVHLCDGALVLLSRR